MLKKGIEAMRFSLRGSWCEIEKHMACKELSTLGSEEVYHEQNSECRRFNAMNIQMLPDEMRNQIFKTIDLDIDEEKKEKCIEKLKTFDLWGKNTEILPNVSFKLPSLIGKNIDEHFANIATSHCGSYVKLILNLCAKSLPDKPTKWSKEAGWTKYFGNGKSTAVDFPDERSLIFDCEVLVPEGQLPVMAVAVSENYWFSWCSDRIYTNSKNSKSNKSIDDLIPMESINSSSSAKNCSRIIIGHNVSYDRARIKEQYLLKESDIRFVDTMSMHTAVSGFTGSQRLLFTSVKKGGNPEGVKRSSWLDAGTMNNLSDVHQFYCGDPISKSSRDVFVEGTMDEVRDQFNDLMDYCSGDVTATYNVLKKIFPIFCKRFPHPVTIASMLEMGNMYLPANKNWRRYVETAERTYTDLNKELQSTLTDIANDACSLLHGEKYKSDPWLWDLDWSTKSYKLLKKPRKGWEAPDYLNEIETTANEQPDYSDTEKICLEISKIKTLYKPSPLMESILNTAASLPKVDPYLPGYPKWYTELCMKESDEAWQPGPVKLSTLTKVTPKLLRMTWYGYYLHHDRSTGWGYLVPNNKEEFANEGHQVEESTCDIDDVLDSDIPERNECTQGKQPVDIPDLPEGYSFYKLPHKSGGDNNVGNPLSQDFLQKMDDGVLKSSDAKGASRCLEINQASSYWRSNHQRIKNQIYMQLHESCIPDDVKLHSTYSDNEIGAIIPITAVCGTVTRRAVENTWLTAINVKEKKIGSELKAMIQAPPGYTFVGADVDSQELWIASLLGDADSAREHGCTPFSWMTLQGTKAKGTDLHSKTADAIGITREQAKVFNYARIYGSGERLARALLTRFNYGMSAKEVNDKIRQLFQMTKGERKYLLSMDGRYYANKLKTINPMAARGGLVSYAEVKTLASAAKSAFAGLIDVKEFDLIVGRVWDGGMESEMFNRIEKIARSMKPSTPVLGARISTALEPSKVWENFLPSRMNWVVQSSAVDYMHLMIVCMRWLIDKFDIKARFSISIHDELRYLCAEEDRYRVALALQISNLLTRSMFAYKLGMNDLPLGVAFFSSVEIDKVIRKQHLDDCITPSNPLGLQSSCGIERGQSLDIFQILEKTNGGDLG